MVLKNTRTVEESLHKVDALIDHYGSEFQVPLINAHQFDDTNLAATVFPSLLIETCVQRLPRDYDNPQGIERALKVKNVIAIANSLKDNHREYPNDIVILLNKDNLNKLYSITIDPHIPKLLYLTVYLSKIKDAMLTAKISNDGYFSNPDDITIAYLIDGHHRCEGCHLAAASIPSLNWYEFVVGLYYNRSKGIIYESYNGINTFQEKPTNVHTTAMEQMAGTLPPDRASASSIMLRLNSDGVLKSRIKTIDGRAPKGTLPTFVSNKKFLDLIEAWYYKENGAKYMELEDRISNQKDLVQLLNNYFEVMKDLYPTAWANNKYVLTKAMGFDLMFRILRQVIKKANTLSSSPTSIPSKSDIKKTVKGLLFEADGVTPITITIHDDDGSSESFMLDWKSSTFGSRSSGKGISALGKAIISAISTKKISP